MLITINGQPQMSFEQFQETFGKEFGRQLTSHERRLFEPAFLKSDSTFRGRRDSELDVCARVKELGYATSANIKLYGEHYEVVSDPFPDRDGVALQVKAKEGADVRTLRLPANVLQSILAQSVKKAS